MKWRGFHVALVAVVVGLAVVGAVAIAPGSAGACSCAVQDDQDAFASADAVFTGTLVDTVDGGRDPSSAPREWFVFEVDRVFKGKVVARQSVVSSDAGSCGLVLSGPSPYVVFARQAAGGHYSAGLCSGTRSLAAAALPATFGVAAAPIPGSSPVSDGGGSTSSTVWLVAGAAVVVVGLAVGGTVVARRRRT